MNKKGISTLVIVAIIVIAVVVVGIAAYYVWTGEEGEPTPTPTPTPNPVEGATSMRFDVVVNFEGDLLETDLFTVKNLGTSDVLLRVDQTDKDGLSFIYLMSQTSQSAWANAMDTGFIDDSENFATYWDSTLIGKPAVDGYMGALANWSGTGDYEFSSGDYSYVISNVVVDPDIPDSAFEPA